MFIIMFFSSKLLNLIIICPCTVICLGDFGLTCLIRLVFIGSLLFTLKSFCLLLYIVFIGGRRLRFYGAELFSLGCGWYDWSKMSGFSEILNLTFLFFGIGCLFWHAFGLHIGFLEIIHCLFCTKINQVSPLEYNEFLSFYSFFFYSGDS